MGAVTVIPAGESYCQQSNLQIVCYFTEVFISKWQSICRSALFGSGIDAYSLHAQLFSLIEMLIGFVGRAMNERADN